MKILRVIVSWWIHIIAHLSKPQDVNTKSEPQCKLWTLGIHMDNEVSM